MDQITHELDKLAMRRAKLLIELIPYVRAAVNVLRDSNCPSTAKALEEVIFQIEAIDDEATKLLIQDPLAVLRAMARRLNPDA